jgi:hypothetical protein
MAHFSYTKTVYPYPPIDNLEEYRQALRKERSQFETGHRDENTEARLLEDYNGVLERTKDAPRKDRESPVELDELQELQQPWHTKEIQRLRSDKEAL